MSTYLAIITTTLVITQVIRVLQNAKQLRYLKKKSHDEDKIVAMWEKMARSIEELNERLEGMK